MLIEHRSAAYSDLVQDIPVRLMEAKERVVATDKVAMVIVHVGCV